jgi:hypothetical protein
VAVDQLMKLANERQADGAKQTVRLLTGSCPDFVYGRDAFKEFSKFVDDGGRLKILAWTKSLDAVRPKLTSLADDHPDQVEVRVSNRDDLNDQIPHFLLVEDGAYRYEVPHAAVDASTCSDFEPEVPAKISFNDEDNGRGLREFFDELWGAMEP